MKKRLTITLAIAFIVAISANSVWASSQDMAAEEECRALAIEQEVSAEEIQQFMADCIEELSSEDDEKDQEDTEKPNQD